MEFGIVEHRMIGNTDYACFPNADQRRNQIFVDGFFILKFTSWGPIYQYKQNMERGWKTCFDCNMLKQLNTSHITTVSRERDEGQLQGRRHS